MSFDIAKYLEQKAKPLHLAVLKAPPQPNMDCVVFAMGSGDKWAGLSLSGLELLQNHTDEAIKSLCDERFEQSLKTLKKFGA